MALCPSSFLQWTAPAGYAVYLKRGSFGAIESDQSRCAFLHGGEASFTKLQEGCRHGLEIRGQTLPQGSGLVRAAVDTPAVSLAKSTKLSKLSKGAASDELVEREAHKYFDQVVVLVKAGDGGNGGSFAAKKGKDNDKKRNVRSHAPKRDADGQIVLPVGGNGADVIVYAEEGMETLLELHKKKKLHGKRGGNVDASFGLTSRIRNGAFAPPLRIPVPIGTVVKRKRGGVVLADLNRPGAEVCVVRGGAGGASVVAEAEARSSEGGVVSSSEYKALTAGAPGEAINLELTLRIVADVGLVGLPNAGKSSLLAAVTAARPDIAAYPFTTLIPNLGRISSDPTGADGGFGPGATMADLPGLIEGAHTGRGLGRMFLRHLRRTRLLVHVVDAAAPDPLADYRILREELRMYNPEYVKRPHLVVLNKVDLPEAAGQWEGIREQILKGDPVRVIEDASGAVEEEDGEKPSVPRAVVAISAKEGLNIHSFLEAVHKALAEDEKSPYLQKERQSERNSMRTGPSWSL